MVSTRPLFTAHTMWSRDQQGEYSSTTVMIALFYGIKIAGRCTVAHTFTSIAAMLTHGHQISILVLKFLSMAWSRNRFSSSLSPHMEKYCTANTVYTTNSWYSMYSCNCENQFWIKVTLFTIHSTNMWKANGKGKPTYYLQAAPTNDEHAYVPHMTVAKSPLFTT